MRSTCARGVQSFRFMPRPNIVFPSPDNYNHRAVFRRAAVDSFFPAVPINLKRSVPLLSLPPSLPPSLCVCPEAASERGGFCAAICVRCSHAARPAAAAAIINTRVSGNE